MTIYDIIYSFTKQLPAIMDGTKQVVGLIGFLIFVFSGRTLLKANANEKNVIAAAWTGLILSTFLMSIQRWMNILTTTLYGTDLGPVYRVGEDFQQTNDAAMIFIAAETYVIAFGWFALIAGTIKFIEAPKQQNPGLRRKATVGLIIAVMCANIQFTIDVAGATFGIDNAYQEAKNKLTR